MIEDCVLNVDCMAELQYLNVKGFHMFDDMGKNLLKSQLNEWKQARFPNIALRRPPIMNGYLKKTVWKWSTLTGKTAWNFYKSIFAPVNLNLLKTHVSVILLVLYILQFVTMLINVKTTIILLIIWRRHIEIVLNNDDVDQ